MLGNPGSKPMVEKTMSCTLAEFETGLRRLTGEEPVRLKDDVYDLSKAAAGKSVTCTFSPQPSAVLGGLLQLPRNSVVIDLSSLEADERPEFVERFERVFQRGGG